jgi:hypothetical protein
MAGYSSYSFKAVKKQFGLKSVKNTLFEDFKPVEPSAWLVGTLEKTMKMAVISEKSRSEWLVSPIMIEIKDKNARSMNILSGENLDVDKDLSLTGECDFLFVRDPDTITVESPIFCLVEAERNDLMGGLGQCVAQMLGARLLNQQDGIDYPAIYGCVTTGTDWQFLKLENQLITLESNLKYIVELNHILGIFQRIIDAFA